MYKKLATERLTTFRIDKRLSFAAADKRKLEDIAGFKQKWFGLASRGNNLRVDSRVVFDDSRKVNSP